MKDPNWIKKCPGDSEKQLTALISACKRGIGAFVHVFGNTASKGIGITNGGVEGVGAIVKALLSNRNRCNKIPNTVDSGLKGFGTGLAKGYVKTLPITQYIPL